ncbi:hypothetical protein A3Q56_05172, partial [Intoshia linei]
MNKKIYNFVVFKKREGRIWSIIAKIVKCNSANYCFVLVAICATGFSGGMNNADVIFSAAVPKFKCIDGVNLNMSMIGANGIVMLSDDHDLFKNYNEECTADCSKFAYSDEFGFTLPVEWGLICDRSFYVFLIGLSVSLGMTASCLCNGYFADRFGRKTSSTFSLFLNLIIRLASIFANSVELYIVFRFIISALDVSMFAHMYLLVIELTPYKYRLVTDIVRPICYALGIIYLPLLYGTLKTWKNCHTFNACVITVICIIIVRFLKKSPTWLNSSKNLNIHFANPRNDNLELVGSRRRRSSAILTIIRDKNIRLKSVALYALSFTTSSIFFGINFNIMAFNRNIYKYTPICNTGYILSALSIIVLKYLKIKKKLVIIFNLFMGTAAFIALNFYNDDLFIMFCILLGIYTMGINIIYAYILTPYQYPVTLRGSGVSYFMLFSFFGVIFGTCIYWFKSSIMTISIIFTVMCIVTAILIILYIPVDSAHKDTDEESNISMEPEENGRSNSICGHTHKKLNNVEIRTIFKKNGIILPSESNCSNKIDDLYLNEMERIIIKNYCINKLIFIIMDETDLNGYKYINTMIATLETTQN